ncbi:MAG: hypothetical protein Q8P86_01405 [bacterium]|nr:hypothetical protein [bacterium]
MKFVNMSRTKITAVIAAIMLFVAGIFIYGIRKPIWFDSGLPNEFYGGIVILFSIFHLHIALSKEKYDYLTGLNVSSIIASIYYFLIWNYELNNPTSNLGLEFVVEFPIMVAVILFYALALILNIADFLSKIIQKVRK